MTSEERAKKFKQELTAFLKERGVEIIIEDTGSGYSSKYEMKVYMDGVYKDGEVVLPFTEVNLGTYIG